MASNNTPFADLAMVRLFAFHARIIKSHPICVQKAQRRKV
jgi:hypothetical protein